MFNDFTLNSRQQSIFRATVQHYIATAEPVGSKTLANEYKFQVSSATIRNALGYLEKIGLLYQPHVSAGRIPSDWGYRLYVDQLLTWQQDNVTNVKNYLHQHLQGDAWNFDLLIQRAAQILASISGYIALITLPQTTTIQLRHLQLVPLSEHHAMMVLIMEGYQTHSIPLELPLSPHPVAGRENLEQELQLLSNFLNSKLRGQTLQSLGELDWHELDQDFIIYGDFLKVLLKQLRPYFQPTWVTPIVIQGVSEVIRQPEFSQLEQVQMLLHLLEQEQDALFPLIFEVPKQDSLTSGSRSLTTKVSIGAENPLEPMKPCTLVSSLYHQGNVPVGSVNIIGPTRMSYEQTIPLVESTADYLSAVLS